MSKFIFGSKNSIHIIDLVQTLELSKAALNEIHKWISSGGKILFVSTKKQATDAISELAKGTSQFYVNHRWLGGMLTNWKTISNSIKFYKKLSEDLKKETTGFTKKEMLKMGIQRDKLERSLGGIAEMKKTPNMIFIIDTNIEAFAVRDALKLNIPIVAIIENNLDVINSTTIVKGGKNYINAPNLIVFNPISNKLVNGPISKKSFLDKKYPGITEYIFDKSKRKISKNPVMLIYNKRLSVSPITTHIPIKDVYKIILSRIKGIL